MLIKRMYEDRGWSLQKVQRVRAALLITRNWTEEHQRALNYQEGMFGRLHTKESLEQRHLFGKTTVVFEGFTGQEVECILNDIGLTKLDERVELLVVREHPHLELTHKLLPINGVK